MTAGNFSLQSMRLCPTEAGKRNLATSAVCHALDTFSEYAASSIGYRRVRLHIFCLLGGIPSVTKELES